MFSRKRTRSAAVIVLSMVFIAIGLTVHTPAASAAGCRWWSGEKIGPWNDFDRYRVQTYYIQTGYFTVPANRNCDDVNVDVTKAPKGRSSVTVCARYLNQYDQPGYGTKLYCRNIPASGGARVIRANVPDYQAIRFEVPYSQGSGTVIRVGL